MFIYSVRASSIRIGAPVVLLGVLLTALVFGGQGTVAMAIGTNTEIDYSRIKSHRTLRYIINFLSHS